VDGSGARAPTQSRALRRITALGLYAALAVALAYAGYRFYRVKSSSPVAAAAAAPARHYVGAAACAGCHAKEYAAWLGSQHQLAMRHADSQSVLGDFNNATFEYAGITSTFFKRDGRYFVNTDGPDGRLHDYQVTYTFGLAPLQQYLIPFPDGRIQALSIAWDTRPKEMGGQRWFHLYPGQAIKAGDRLHWTGIDQNWNYQCADCHSTHLLKNFDAASNTFKTTWSDISVACESCHGPGSQHLAWSNKHAHWQQIADKGLSVQFNERRGVGWSRKPEEATATRSVPLTTSVEIDTCAHCHSRRGQLHDGEAPGHPLGDSYRPALLEADLYWPDGQMRGEVYNYGSFLQSKMHSKGVTCSDCHDPHTLRLRAPGNLVCAQCHNPARFDALTHSHHAPGSAGAQCAACHMPVTTYMQVDARHDHSLRIPRPDRTRTLGVPNACNQCHRDRSAQWALARTQTWVSSPAPGHQSFAEAIYAGEHITANGRSMLLAAADDSQQPAIARATALTLLTRYPGPRTAEALQGALRDGDPLVRGAAVEALAGEAPEQRLRWLLPMAADTVRSVRIDAAQALAGVPLENASAQERAALSRAIDEFLAAQLFNADRPEAHANLGTYYATTGQHERAEAELRKALAIDPAFVPASVNLADLYRAGGNESQAESVLRSALQRQRNRQVASLHYALGLSLARQQRSDDALGELHRAMLLGPDQARYAYVYGVALHSGGRAAEAIKVLAEAHKRYPGDIEILQALATMERDLGQLKLAHGYAQRLVELVPDDPQAQALLRELAP
jgi:tetratricopeptide (TPR) repeat protein